MRARSAPLSGVGVIISAAASVSVALPEMASNAAAAPGFRLSVLQVEDAVCCVW